jgi:hypothetical protein
MMVRLPCVSVLMTSNRAIGRGQLGKLGSGLALG